MTATPSVPTSRRALIAGAAGAAVASVLSALGRPAPTRATNGGFVQLGFTSPGGDGTGTNEASATTKIVTTTGDGLYGQSQSSSGRGLVGYATATSGTNYGVYGRANGNDGTGVFGYATSDSGFTHGVFGKSLSIGGYGVYAEGLGTAIRGESLLLSGSGGTAIVGRSQAPSAGTGISGSAIGTSGVGIRGFATAETSATIGVLGSVSSPDGIGVRGSAGPLTGATTGVLGYVQSPDGTAVRGTGNSGVGVRGVGSTGVIGAAGAGADAVAKRPSTGVYGWCESASGVGVYGKATSGQGMIGESATGTGVRGISAQGHGIEGWSTDGDAILGFTNKAGRIGVIGAAQGHSTGVLGYSGASQPEHPEKTGVYGAASQDGSSIGVGGKATYGTGVMGVSGSPTADVLPVLTGNTGVYGRADADGSSRGVSGYSAAGFAVHGQTGTGIALFGQAGNSSAFALKTTGRVLFTKVSGMATIPAGALTSGLIATNTNVTATSYGLATPQSDPGARRIWITLEPVGNTVAINTNATAGTDLKVAWFVIG